MKALWRTLLAIALFAWSTAVAAGQTASGPPARLPELPRVPSLELAAPRVEDLAAVDEVLERITSDDATGRDAAMREILELGPRLVVAMRRRLGSIAEQANRNAMKIML